MTLLAPTLLGITLLTAILLGRTILNSLFYWVRDFICLNRNTSSVRRRAHCRSCRIGLKKPEGRSTRDHLLCPPVEFAWGLLGPFQACEREPIGLMWNRKLLNRIHGARPVPVKYHESVFDDVVSPPAGERGISPATWSWPKPAPNRSSGNLDHLGAFGTTTRGFKELRASITAASLLMIQGGCPNGATWANRVSHSQPFRKLSAYTPHGVRWLFGHSWILPFIPMTQVWLAGKPLPKRLRGLVSTSLLVLFWPGMPGFSTPQAPGVAGLGPSRQPAAISQLEEGRKAYGAGNFQQAEILLKEVVRADPKSAEAYLLLGLAEFANGETTEAIRHYQRAIGLRPKSFSGHYNLALAYLRERNVQPGLRELERAVDLDPQSSDAAYNLGTVLLESGRPLDALVYLRRARELGPAQPDVAFRIIGAELEANQPDAAGRYAAEAAKSFGADPKWVGAVGQLFLEKGQTQIAVPFLREASKLQPAQDDFRRQLALAELRSHAPGEVLETIQNPTSAEDYYLRASAFYAMHRPLEADEACRQALAIAPREPRSILLRARIRQYVGQHDSALELLRQAIQLAPEWSEPYYSEAASYYFERRYAEARQCLDRSLLLEPRSARSLFLYAATLVNEGRNREGEKYLREAIALEPRNARFEYHLGILLLRDNRPSEAQEAFTKSIELKSDYAPPRYQLGKLLLQNNQPEAALHELELAVGYQPEFAEAYYQLARAYGQLGESARSQQALAEFDNLKKQGSSEDLEFVEEIRKQLDSVLE